MRRSRGKYRNSEKQQFGFDVPTVALYVSWLPFDYAREFADRISIAPFVDVDLSLLQAALPRGGHYPEDRREQAASTRS
jgi:hypothetical protein